MLLKIRKALKNPKISNSIWSLLEAAFYPVLLLISMGFFINRLGAQEFGIWNLANSIIATMGFLNIGLGNATIKYVAEYRAKQQNDKIRDVINATFSIYFVFALGVVVLGIGFAAYNEFFDAYKIFKISSSYKRDFSIIIFLAFFTFGLRFLEQILLAVFKGFERYDISSKLVISSKFIILVLNILLVYWGFSLVSIFINSTLATLFLLFAEFYFVKRFFPAADFAISFEKRKMAMVWSYGLWAGILGILGILGSQIDKLLVSTVAGVSVLGFYAYGAGISERGLGILASACGWFMPSVSRKLSEGKSIVSEYKKMQFLVVGVGLLGALILYAVRKPFFGLLLGSKMPLVMDYIEVFLIYFVLIIVSIVPFFVLTGAAAMRLSTLMRIMSLVLQVPLMFAGYYYLGNIGLGYAVALTFGLVLPINLTLTEKYVLHTDRPLLAFRYLIPSYLAAGVFFEILPQELRFICLAACLLSFWLIFYLPSKFKLKDLTK